MRNWYILILLGLFSGCMGHRYHPCIEKGIETCPDWAKKNYPYLTVEK